MTSPDLSRDTEADQPVPYTLTPEAEALLDAQAEAEPEL